MSPNPWSLGLLFGSAAAAGFGGSDGLTQIHYLCRERLHVLVLLVEPHGQRTHQALKLGFRV